MSGVRTLYGFRRWYDPDTRLWTAEESTTGARAHGTTWVQAETRLRRKMTQTREALAALEEA